MGQRSAYENRKYLSKDDFVPKCKSRRHSHRRSKSEPQMDDVFHYGLVNLTRSTPRNKLHNSFGLPDEALQIIFLYLSIRDLHMLLLVCKTWRRIAIAVGNTLKLSEWIITNQVQGRVRKEIAAIWDSVYSLRTRHILKCQSLSHKLDLTVDLFVTGWRHVGKTALCYTFKDKAYPKEYLPMCFDKWGTQLEVNVGSVKLLLWDAEVTDNELYRKTAI